MNAIQMMAKFYEARDAARFLLGADYTIRIEQWKRLIRLVMERDRVTELKACLTLMQQTDDAHAHLFLLAATVDVLEPNEAAS